jgi:hypothetical protein
VTRLRRRRDRLAAARVSGGSGPRPGHRGPSRPAVSGWQAADAWPRHWQGRPGPGRDSVTVTR